jgi:4-methoxybenzoate monooxygenase (O-demethylating)
MPEGAVVFLSFIPDRRNVRHHLGFGQGSHACLGNVLARMEAAGVLRELAQRVDRLEAVDPAAASPSCRVRVHPREPDGPR